jgi:hypothetical protein
MCYNGYSEIRKEVVQMKKYTAIKELSHALESAGVPHTITPLFNGSVVHYRVNGKLVCSVAQHDYSIGSKTNTVELWGLLTPEEAMDDNEVVGYLSAMDAYERICAHWEWLT